MTPLEKIIIDKIKKQDLITFETFMDMALYYPGLGYYTSPDLKIGRKGDFYTSPHLHKIFGAMIGKQLEEMWEIIERPSVFHAVEIGAGAGYLCKDILDYLKTREIFQSLNYIIVEINPVMIEKQKELLSNPPNPPFIKVMTRRGGERGLLDEKVKWISSLRELNNIRGCIFSNELLDAFPVHVVEIVNEDYPSPTPLPQREGVRGRVKEIYVAFDGNKIIELKQDISSIDIINYIKEFSIDIPNGYRTEINLKIKDWLKEISEILHEGFVITIDYGYTAKEYYDEERSKGTLLCYHKHRMNENPYENIGKQDITAHVNFSSLKKWGEEIGFKTIGYCPQGTFLISLGIDEVITELYGNSLDYESEILKIKGLILPQGMGESHRVMIQYKGERLPTLRGFSMRNQINTL
ncbi:MAG: SAM-dependent methyltransferase [Thermodesulfovibrionia bacterium]|nr:SAM-dependent methyltransferase [Thermodesulfovibrionia bacterium]